MSNHNFLSLKQEFSHLFHQIESIQHQEGWMELIYQLSKLITHYTDFHSQNKDKIYFVQIKEKFGQLRIYMNHTTPFIDGLIAMAEQMSSQICEVCGQPGKNHNVKMLLKTVCEPHLVELKQKRHAS